MEEENNSEDLCGFQVAEISLCISSHCTFVWKVRKIFTLSVQNQNKALLTLYEV